jgi:hypothetical protein
LAKFGLLLKNARSASPLLKRKEAHPFCLIFLSCCLLSLKGRDTHFLVENRANHRRETSIGVANHLWLASLFCLLALQAKDGFSFFEIITNRCFASQRWLATPIDVSLIGDYYDLKKTKNKPSKSCSF